MGAVRSVWRDVKEHVVAQSRRIRGNRTPDIAVVKEDSNFCVQKLFAIELTLYASYFTVLGRVPIIQNIDHRTLAPIVARSHLSGGRTSSGNLYCLCRFHREYTLNLSSFIDSLLLELALCDIVSQFDGKTPIPVDHKGPALSLSCRVYVLRLGMQARRGA